jgi:DNA-binding transcriptional LysR family regulator
MHPETTLELVSILSVDTQAALDQGRIQLALCDTEYLQSPLRWRARLPLLWAVAEGFDATQNPLPLVIFSEPCRWRSLIQAALSAAGIGSRVVFESGSLTAVQAAVRAGLGATVLLPTAMAPGLVSSPVSNILPPVPMLEFGMARRMETLGDRLTDAVEELLKQLIRPEETFV